MKYLSIPSILIIFSIYVTCVTNSHYNHNNFITLKGEQFIQFNYFENHDKRKRDVLGKHKQKTLQLKTIKDKHLKQHRIRKNEEITFK